MSELAPTVAGRSDIPADIKASVDALAKELAALTPKFAAPAFGRGGGGGGAAGASAGTAGRGSASESIIGRISQAKNGLMAGMSPTEQTIRAYNDSQAQAPNP